MNAGSDYKHSFVGDMMQSAGADFLASFSELLRVSSLLERRPDGPLDHPDVDRSLRKARWLVRSAIDTFHGLLTSLAHESAADAHDAPESGSDLGRLLVAAVDRGILIENASATRLVTRLISTHDARQVVLTFAHQLKACREALDRIDLTSKPEDFAVALQTAVSTYANNLIKGQYVAYVNRII